MEIMDKNINQEWEAEVQKDKRFQFGENWKSYASTLSTEAIEVAQDALTSFLGDITNKTFLDIGSGSGLHSLAARNLKASVYSFDYDHNSVECTRNLHDKFYPGDTSWTVTQASILDKDFVKSLGQYDIVYSWGVLHHTGSMWEAIQNAMSLAKKDGLFFIAIYNKQGWKSRFWWHIKNIYHKLPGFTKKGYALTLGVTFQVINIVKYTLLLKPQVAIKPLLNYRKNRGMSIKHDIIDWIGGFPYEYATTEELNDFCKKNGFVVVKEIKTGSLGCNQVVYKKLI